MRPVAWYDEFFDGAWWFDIQRARYPGESAAKMGDSVNDTIKLMHVYDRHGAEEAFREAVEKGGPFEITYRIQHADGAWRLIRDRGFCAHDRDGVATRVLGIMADVTDEQEGEELDLDKAHRAVPQPRGAYQRTRAPIAGSDAPIEGARRGTQT